jgi:outer membrane autotransporter protein
LAFSSTYDRFHLKEFSGRATINSYYGGLYAHWNCGRFYTNGALLGALSRYQTTRQLNFGTIDRQARSKHNGHQGLTHLGVGYRMCQSHFQWIPYIDLDYVFQHERGYTEAGADSLDLNVKPKNGALFQGEVGVSFNTACSVCHGVLTPMLTLAYVNQTPCSSKNYYASFVNSSCIFIGEGGGYGRNLFAPYLDFTYQGFCNRVSASIYYDAEVGSRYWAQDVGFDLTFRF